jgi:hypothetical protein
MLLCLLLLPSSSAYFFCLTMRQGNDEEVKQAWSELHYEADRVATFLNPRQAALKKESYIVSKPRLDSQEQISRSSEAGDSTHLRNGGGPSPVSVPDASQSTGVIPSSQIAGAGPEPSRTRQESNVQSVILQDGLKVPLRYLTVDFPFENKDFGKNCCKSLKSNAGSESLSIITRVYVSSGFVCVCHMSALTCLHSSRTCVMYLPCTLKVSVHDIGMQSRFLPANNHMFMRFGN